MGALGPLLGLLRAILGRRETIWGASKGDLAAILPVLARTCGLWGRSWAVIGGSWGDLGPPKRGNPGRVSAVLARSVAPPRDFLRKYLPSRDLKSLLIEEMFRGSHNTPCRAAQGAADLGRAARGHRRPHAVRGGEHGFRSEECVGCGAAASCDYLLASFCFM